MKINNHYLPFIITIAILFMVTIGLVLFLDAHKDYNCNNFKTQKEAMEVFKKHSNDIYHLDGDNDGIPCESLAYGKK